MTMVGAPVVAETSSNAYAVCTKEGSLHVNHDRGAAAVLPTEGVALFAMLDGHGQEGAPVSGFSQQNLFGAARAALAARERREAPRAGEARTQVRAVAGPQGPASPFFLLELADLVHAPGVGCQCAEQDAQHAAFVTCHLCSPSMIISHHVDVACSDVAALSPRQQWAACTRSLIIKLTP